MEKRRRKGSWVYITVKERDTILAAIDFIHTNSDGALNYKPFADMQNTLWGLHDKSKAAIHSKNKKQ